MDDSEFLIRVVVSWGSGFIYESELDFFFDNVGVGIGSGDAVRQTDVEKEKAVGGHQSWYKSDSEEERNEIHRSLVWPASSAHWAFCFSTLQCPWSTTCYLKICNTDIAIVARGVYVRTLMVSCA
jgi:hypothetical protein